MSSDHQTNFSFNHQEDLKRLAEIHELKDELGLNVQMGLSMARMDVPKNIAFKELDSTLDRMHEKLTEFESELFFDIAMAEVVESLQEVKTTLHAHGG